MKTDSIVQSQAIPLSGRKRSLIEDARRDSSSPGPSRCGDSFVFEEEKSGKVPLNILFSLRNEKNAGFFKAGKVFEVRAFTYSLQVWWYFVSMSVSYFPLFYFFILYYYFFILTL